MKRTLANPEDRAALAERVRRLTADSQRKWGSMTAHQAVCHLADSFKMCTGAKAVAPTTPNAFNRVVVKWIALDAPFPWPHGVKTRPEADQMVGGTPPGVFARDVEDLLDTLAHFAPGCPGFGEWPHPIFGMMTEANWLRWGYLHVDHHLRQFGV